VAADRAGGRLGRGGGHYDRLLPLLRARGWRVVGVAHAAHLLDELPAEAHDARLDRVLSESGWLEIAAHRPPPSAAGIVLAGGRSSRFGSAKAGATVGGVAMLARVVAVLAGCCDEIVLVVAPDASSRDALALARAEDLAVPVRVLRDASAHAGPATALAGALGRVGTELAFASGCDSPLLSPTLVRGLLAHAARCAACDLVAPDRGKGLEPLLAVYRVATMARALAVATDAGPVPLRDALAGVRHLRIAGEELDVLDPDGASFLNVNRPGDLGEVERRLVAPTTGTSASSPAMREG
jgi:molybdopterin-guanine dinucleotide biosynthesis protein A